MILKRQQNARHQQQTDGMLQSSSQHQRNTAGQHLFSSLRRKPAPEQPAPEQPNGRQTNGSSQFGNQWRSQTLDRRNHFRRSNWDQKFKPKQPSEDRSIYAPASIACANELNGYTKPSLRGVTSNDESQHYAATSLASNQPNAATPNGTERSTWSTGGSRSGRDSALSNLFGTIRRKGASWVRGPSSASSSRPSKSTLLSRTNSLPRRFKQTVETSKQADTEIYGIPQISTLDPEIYATSKRQVQADEIYAEGARALDLNERKRLLEWELDAKVLKEGESRLLVVGHDQQYVQLVGALRGWINDVLSQQRIIVRDLADDLYDGQILAKLIETLQHIHFDLVEVTQNEASQRRKLETVLGHMQRQLAQQARWAKIRWSIDGIHSKNMVEILHLLITMAIFHRAPLKLPEHVQVRVLEVRKIRNELVRQQRVEQLTSEHELRISRQLAIIKSRHQQVVGQTQNGNHTISAAPASRQQNQIVAGKTKDAFDIIMELEPDKLVAVQRSLIRFANRHLNKVNMTTGSESQTLDAEQFSDGLLFVFLISTLEDYFVPLGNLFTEIIPNNQTNSDIYHYPSELLGPRDHITQTAISQESYIHSQPLRKLHNVNLSLQLMAEAGVAINADQIRAEDIVNSDPTTIMRVLYSLFSKYRHL